MMQFERLKYRLLAITLLAVPCLAAFYLAFLVRFDGALNEFARFTFGYSVWWVTAVKVVTMLHARIHRHCARYVTFHDMLSLVRAVTISSVAIMLVDAMLVTDVVIPRSVMLLDWGTTILLLAAVRIAPRLIRDGYWHRLSTQQGCPVLIVGANDAGEALLRSLRSNPTMPYRVVGFLDDRPEYWGRRIAGIPVLGTQTDLPTLVIKHQIEEVLITNGTLPGKEVRRLVELASRENFRVKVLPSYEQLVGEKVDVNPRSVAIADLLQRPSVQLDDAKIRHWLSGKVVLVSGSAGSIGSEICRQLVELAPAKIVIVDRSETGQFFLERELRQLATQIEIAVALADLTDAARLANRL